MHTPLLRSSLIPLLLFALSAAAGAEDLLGEAESLFQSASAAYQKAADTGDREGQDQAAADLRQALELFNRHLDQHPEDLPRLESALTEINAALFWHGRMSTPDLWEGDESPTQELERQREREQRDAELARLREEEAARLLASAREYGQSHPEDLYGRRIELREVLIQHPDSEAAADARVEIEAIERAIVAREAAPSPAPDSRSAGGDPKLEEVEPGAAPATDDRAIPLLHLMNMRLDAMQGSDAERFVLEQTRELFDKRRFIEARDRARVALQRATDPGDEGRIDRILAGLARAVTIMDHAVEEVRATLGEEATLGLIGGASFAGRLEGLTWNAIVLRTTEATIHVPCFRLSDETLVELSAARKSPEAALAAAAFLALTGNGKQALSELRKAGKLGAPESEIAELRHLAGDEKAKRDLEAEIRSESRRWRKVVGLRKKLVQGYLKQKWLDLLKALLKEDQRTGLTDRDLAWLSRQTGDELGETLERVILNARETCRQTHLDEVRNLQCPGCKGAGTILTRSPGGLFGVKKKTPVRVRCPTCDGKKVMPCPECFDRFTDKDARQLQQRAGLAVSPLPPAGGGVDR